jgi:prepilin-type N-terminal cleavage/methylation domain-containing protein
MESTPLYLRQRGFTVVELIVVIAIIIILTAVVLNGQKDFNRSLTITDSAYTIALSLREAQTFGLSSRAVGAVNNAGYGARFSTATPGSYILFADLQQVQAQPAWCPTTHSGLADDKPGNCLFDNAAETVQTFSFGRGFYISKICGYTRPPTKTLKCSTDSTPLTSIDMVFLRPNTDSVITGVIGGSTVQLDDASIYLSAPNGEGVRAVCVSYAGQISVASTTCP